MRGNGCNHIQEQNPNRVSSSWIFCYCYVVKLTFTLDLCDHQNKAHLKQKREVSFVPPKSLPEFLNSISELGSLDFVQSAVYTTSTFYRNSTLSSFLTAKTWKKREMFLITNSNELYFYFKCLEVRRTLKNSITFHASWVTTPQLCGIVVYQHTRLRALSLEVKVLHSLHHMKRLQLH